MNQRKQKSAVGEILDFIVTLFVSLIVGGVLAAGFYILGLGSALIPDWVFMTCIALYGVASALAFRKKDVDGLVVGTLIMFNLVFLLGLAEFIGVKDLSGKVELIVTVCPILGGVLAIAIPLLR